MRRYMFTFSIPAVLFYFMVSMYSRFDPVGVNAGKIDLNATLRMFKIVPKILRETPKHILEVKYKNFSINLGNNITEPEIEEPPVSIKWPSEENVLYTLLMIGPDVPTRKEPAGFDWRHWVVANIPGNDIDKGDTLVEYENVEPFYHGGYHRNIFVVYKQANPEKIRFNMKNVIKKGAPEEIRGVFYMVDFIKKYNMTEAVAMNFFFLVNLNPHPEITTSKDPLY